jgi:hypothetical protein
MASWRVDELVSELDIARQDSETSLLSELKDPRVGLSARPRNPSSRMSAASYPAARNRRRQ